MARLSRRDLSNAGAVLAAIIGGWALLSAGPTDLRVLSSDDRVPIWNLTDSNLPPGETRLVLVYVTQQGAAPIPAHQGAVDVTEFTDLIITRGEGVGFDVVGYRRPQTGGTDGTP